MNEIATRRRVLAGLWMAPLVMAITAEVTDASMLMLLAWASAIVLTFITVAAAKLSRDERLVHPRAYRVVAFGVLGVAIFGVSLGLKSDASDLSRVFAVFFGILGLLAFRAVVARSPRPAMLAVAVTLWAWIPFVFLTMLGCKRPHHLHDIHWTMLASRSTMMLALYLLPVLVTATLLAWSRRDDFVPDARVV